MPLAVCVSPPCETVPRVGPLVLCSASCTFWGPFREKARHARADYKHKGTRKNRRDPCGCADRDHCSLHPARAVPFPKGRWLARARGCPKEPCAHAEGSVSHRTVVCRFSVSQSVFPRLPPSSPLLLSFSGFRSAAFGPFLSCSVLSSPLAVVREQSVQLHTAAVLCGAHDGRCLLQ
jgi:hypothetical protein